MSPSCLEFCPTWQRCRSLLVAPTNTTTTTATATTAPTTTHTNAGATATFATSMQKRGFIFTRDETCEASVLCESALSRREPLAVYWPCPVITNVLMCNRTSLDGDRLCGRGRRGYTGLEILVVGKQTSFISAFIQEGSLALETFSSSQERSACSCLQLRSLSFSSFYLFFCFPSYFGCSKDSS